MQQNEPEQHEAGPQQVETANATPPSTPVEQELEDAQRKAEEYLDLLRRTQADFVNYKRRAAQEQADGRVAAQSALLEELLPVLDDLGRALASVPAELTNNPWVQGILLVEKRLTSTLEQIGVQQVGKPGEQFNPHVHDALMNEPRQDMAEGTIVSVARPGYVYKERVVRPAQVVVASAPVTSS